MGLKNYHLHPQLLVLYSFLDHLNPYASYFFLESNLFFYQLYFLLLFLFLYFTLDKANFMHWLWDKFCNFLGLTRFCKPGVQRKMSDLGRKKKIASRRNLAEKVSRKKKIYQTDEHLRQRAEWRIQGRIQKLNSILINKSTRNADHLSFSSQLIFSHSTHTSRGTKFGGSVRFIVDNHSAPPSLREAKIQFKAFCL